MNKEIIDYINNNDFSITLNGDPVDIYPYGLDDIILINIGKTNDYHLTKCGTIVVSTETFLKTTLTKQGKF